MAECRYQDRRLIVRRTRLTGAAQRRLWPDWRHFGFLTDLAGDVVDRLTVARTMRVRLIAVLGRLVNRAGVSTLRGPSGWPWAAWFTGRLQRLRALRPVPS